MNEWCFRPRFCTVRLYWTGDNLGWWDEFYDESYPWCKSIARPVDQQSSSLPLCYGCPPSTRQKHGADVNFYLLFIRYALPVSGVSSRSPYSSWNFIYLHIFFILFIYSYSELSHTISQRGNVGREACLGNRTPDPLFNVTGSDAFTN